MKISIIISTHTHSHTRTQGEYEKASLRIMGKDIYNTYIWGGNVALRIYFANQEGKRQITQQKKRNDGSSTAQNGQ